MKKKTSDLTLKISAFSEIPNFETDECIDWSKEMIELGYKSNSLTILSELNKPTNYFEAIELLEKAFNELDLKFTTGNEALISYSLFLIKKISESKNIKENLRTLMNISIEKPFEKLVFDFFLLYWAWNDLEYGNTRQEYWKGASLNNIKKISIETANDFINKNKFTLPNTA